METLNVECDLEAKACLQRTIDQGIEEFDPCLRHSGCMVQCQGWKISTELDTVLYDQIHQDGIMNYWNNKQPHFTQMIQWSVDWRASGAALRQLSSRKHIWLCKHISGHCAVGRVMVRRGSRMHAECPRCGAEDETTTHILRCPQAEALNIWNTHLEDLKTWLISRSTHPILTNTLIAGLRRWHANLPPLSSNSSEWDKKCLLSQNRIGWENLLHGRAALEWAEQQHAYYKHLKMRRTGRRWIIALLQKLWDISWSMWDHRNRILHDDAQHTVLGNNELDMAIKSQFKLGYTEVPHELRFILDVTLEEVLSYSVWKKTRWLEDLNAARSLGNRRRQALPANQLTLEHWLTTS